MRSSTPNRSFKTARFARDANKAKKDRDNIDNAELLAFRLLAKSYAGLTAHQLGQLLINKDLLEICHDDKTEIQK
jgi:hypothetical protein